MDISTIANLVNAIAVTAGVIFAATQIQEFRAQRRRDSMLNLVRSFQSPTFAQALRLVVNLPENATAAAVRAQVGSQGEDLIYHLTGVWESVGLLLYNHELTIELVDDFFSGPILLSWRKLEPYIRESRRELERDTWSEWFEWLVDKIKAKESVSPSVQAYIAHKGE